MSFKEWSSKHCVPKDKPAGKLAEKLMAKPASA